VFEAFAASHPDNQSAGGHSWPSTTRRRAYATIAYYRHPHVQVLNREDRINAVRWRFVPQDGERRSPMRRCRPCPGIFLERALIERTKQGPVRWTNAPLPIGEPGRPEDDFRTLALAARRRKEDEGPGP